jgi:hypothetical protein
VVLSREPFRRRRGRLEETRSIFATWVQKHLQEKAGGLPETKYTDVALDLSNTVAGISKSKCDA